MNEHYYEFDTIYDATQVQQDAVDELCNMHHDPDQPEISIQQNVLRQKNQSHTVKWMVRLWKNKSRSLRVV